MGDRYDKASGEVLHAVDRAHSAVIQADSAKTAQEEMRHLIRALATVSEVFILTPKKIQETYRDVLERLQRQAETLAAAIPAMPPTPDQLAARIDATTGRVDRFLSRCEVTAANLEKGLTAQVATMTDRLRAAGEDLGREARSVATQRHNHDFWVFLLGVLLGTLMAFGAAHVWRGWTATAKPKVSALAGSRTGVHAMGVCSPGRRICEAVASGRIGRWAHRLIAVEPLVPVPPADPVLGAQLAERNELPAADADDKRRLWSVGEVLPPNGIGHLSGGRGC
jgi:hypothetical protein